MPAPADALIEIVKALLVPGGLLATATAIVLGWKKGPGTVKPVEATVVSATIADAAALRELVEAVKHNTNILIAHRAEDIVKHARDEAARIELVTALDGVARAIRRSGAVPQEWFDELAKLTREK